MAIVGDNLQVTYSMAGVQVGQKFDVALYSSLDNYAAPLEHDMIVGDLGKNLTLKSGNLITIGEPLETLGAITADLNFKVRVTMIYNPVTVTEPAAFFKQKRMKDMTVTWSGGLGGEQVKFDLYKDNQLIRDNFYTTVNNRVAEFEMPKVALGPGYTMMMQFESLNTDVVLPDFEVKRKKSIFARVFNWTILLAAVDFALYATTPTNDEGYVNSADELGGFLFKNFDPLTLVDPNGGTDPNPSTDLPDPPSTPDQFRLSRISILTIPFGN